MRSVTKEIKNYRYSALEARGDDVLAQQWRMAAAQAHCFHLQQQWPKNFSSIPKQEKKNDLRAMNIPYHVATAQEGAQSMLKALEALQKKNSHLAQALVTRVSASRESVASYHYWMAEAKKGAYEHLSEKIIFSREAAEGYRLKALQANENNHPALAQQWAEAACLAQEAARKFITTQDTHHHTLNNLATDYWRGAAHAAYHAAQLQAAAAQSTLLHNEELALHWLEAAYWAENAMILKVKAAHANEKSELFSIDYSLAGYWSALSSEIKVFLINQKTELPLWKKAFIATQEASYVREQSLKNKENHSSSIEKISFTEDVADRAILLAESNL